MNIEDYLGKTIKAKILNVVGIVTTIEYSLYAAAQLGVQPTSKPDGLFVPEGWAVDAVEDQIEILTAEPGYAAMPAQPAGTAVGDYVQDTVTGFEGTVTRMARCLNGCWLVTVQPKRLDKDGNPAMTKTFFSPRLTSVLKEEARKPEKEEKKEKKTGGPIGRILRAD